MDNNNIMRGRVRQGAPKVLVELDFAALCRYNHVNTYLFRFDEEVSLYNVIRSRN